MVRATLLAAFASFALTAAAFADEAAPIAPDSPEANGGASASTIGKGITNDGSSATVSAPATGTGSAPSAGSLGANDPDESGDGILPSDSGDATVKPAKP